MAKTRDEHLASMVKMRSGRPEDNPSALQLTRYYDYAVEHGMEVKDTSVDPVVGNILTKDTRLVHHLAVADDQNGADLVYQYSEKEALFYTAGIDIAAGIRPRRMIGTRIIYVPGVEPESVEPVEYVTGLTAYDNRTRYVCSCGHVGGWHDDVNTTMSYADDHRASHYSEEAQ